MELREYLLKGTYLQVCVFGACAHIRVQAIIKQRTISIVSYHEKKNIQKERTIPFIVGSMGKFTICYPFHGALIKWLLPRC